MHYKCRMTKSKIQKISITKILYTYFLIFRVYKTFKCIDHEYEQANNILFWCKMIVLMYNVYIIVWSNNTHHYLDKGISSKIK